MVFTNFKIADLLKEIKKFQASYTLLIPGLPMQSLVQEVMAEVQPDCKYRIQRSAIKALEESMECFVTTWFTGMFMILDIILEIIILIFTAANLAALHSKRVTLMVKDLDLVREMSAVIGGPSIHEVMRQKGQQATKTTITEQVVEIVEDN